jgi:hypothetical protein
MEIQDLPPTPRLEVVADKRAKISNDSGLFYFSALIP